MLLVYSIAMGVIIVTGRNQSALALLVYYIFTATTRCLLLNVLRSFGVWS